MRFIYILAISSIALVASCTPQYETTYSFVPPKDLNERKCANQCVAEKNNCVNNCNQSFGAIDTASNILSTLVDSANDRYTRNESDRVATCTTQCNESHRICHKNCGGEVIVNTKCIAHCK